MRSAASRRNARPPIPVPGAADRSPSLRPTVKRRVFVRPRSYAVSTGYSAHHPYVRRYWTAALGPGAVADLLRLMRAAEKSQRIRRPTNTAALARAGLVLEDAGILWVRSLVPPLPPDLLGRLPQVLQREVLAEG